MKKSGSLGNDIIKSSMELNRKWIGEFFRMTDYQKTRQRAMGPAAELPEIKVCSENK